MCGWVFDSEVYKNFYLIAFMSNKGDVLKFRAPFSAEDRKQIRSILQKDTVIGFNSLNYDLPLLTQALRGDSEAEIKRSSDKIIQNNLRWWQSGDLPEFVRHIDLIEVAFGKASLKIYGGRLNSKRMQSLPTHFDKVLTEDEKNLIEEYCVNDLQVTALLARNLRQQLAIRKEMSKIYGVDLMSKSDAQIAEAVIKQKLNTSKRIVEPGYEFKYAPPKWLRFKSKDLKDAFAVICDTDFVVTETGKVKLPDEIKTVEVGGKDYKMGIGGLHSMEKKCHHLETDDVVISDHDVASYYPSIILNEGLFPEHLGDEFLVVYREIVEERLKAKKDGDKVTADTLKIVINGSFGKFGSKYSVLFAPEMLIQVTLTGQLALLMLIDLLEYHKIPVVSANTDGIVLACPVDRIGLRDRIIKKWETVTGFVTEETRYKGLYSRDVNNYLAVKEDGAKGKGIFAKPSMAKNTQHPIVFEAVAKHLANGDDLEEVIRGCEDVSKFCCIRTVKGGALSADGVELGSAIRWYYSVDSTGPITYAVNGNKVPQTDGAVAMMELAEEVPSDMDYQWYVDTAKGVLADVGIST